METESMPSSGVARRAAIGGGKVEKNQPPVPSEVASAQVPRSSTPTGHSSRQRSQKPPARSTTVDPSMSVATAAKQPAQPPPPSVPPGLPAPPLPSVSGKQTPSDDWEKIPRVDPALIDGLQAKIAVLEATVKQKDADLKWYKDDNRKLQEELAFLKNKCENLESQSYRNEVLSIRRHLQIDEQHEPWEINKRFGEIVRKVEDISRDMGEELGSLPPIGSHTTLELLKIVSRKSDGPSLIAATPKADLDLEDFIDFGCRALINEALYKTILSSFIFHPGLGPEDNAQFCKMYDRIRREESQVVAGRWRTSTLKLHSDRTYSPQAGALHLCDRTLIPFCSTVVESKACIELIQSMFPRFEELFKRAYDWNYMTKHSIIMLDFHSHFQDPGSPYEASNVLLEGRRPKPPSSNAILLTSKLGLWSSSAIGGGKEPEYSFQTKSTMLAAEYFTS